MIMQTNYIYHEQQNRSRQIWPMKLIHFSKLKQPGLKNAPINWMVSTDLLPLENFVYIIKARNLRIFN